MDCSHLQRVAGRVLERLGQPGREVAVVLISDRTMRRLNRTFRGKVGTTDVLSFPESEARDYLGDIFISTETAAGNARAARHSLRRETACLVLHGLLHLLGYDHETDAGEMNRLERRLRRSEALAT